MAQTACSSVSFESGPTGYTMFLLRTTQTGGNYGIVYWYKDGVFQGNYANALSTPSLSGTFVMGVVYRFKAITAQLSTNTILETVEYTYTPTVPVPRNLRETITNDSPWTQNYGLFANQGGELKLIPGSNFEVPPYSSREMNITSDDLTGDISIGRLNDVGNGVPNPDSNSVFWLGTYNQAGSSTTNPAPNPTRPIPSNTHIGGAVTGNATANTQTGTPYPISYNQTSGGATATDQGTAKLIYGMGTQANGLLEQIAANTKKTADAVDDTQGKSAPETIPEPEDKLQVDPASVLGLPAKVLPKVPAITLPGQNTSFSAQLPIPHAGTYPISLDTSRYAGPIEIFKAVVRAGLALWFFFLAVKTVKGAFSDNG